MDAGIWCNMVASATVQCIVTMDNTIPKSDYEKVLRNFDRKKNGESATEANERSRDIVSSIGTESPLTVLIDIRQIMCNTESSISALSENVRSLATLLQTESARQQERHEQTLAFMHSIASKLESVPQPRASMSVSDMSIMSPTPGKQTYYFRGDEIKSPESLIGCVLMHLEQHTARLTEVEPSFNDTTVTEFTNWGSAVRVLKGDGADKINVMPLKSFDATTALEIVASPMKGRPVSCRIEQINDLCNRCPNIMSQVEEFRKRLIRCPGIVNTRKMLVLAQLSYPYVTTEGVLNVRREAVEVKASQNVVNLVKSLNQPQRSRYVLSILKGDKPIVAANGALRKD